MSAERVTPEELEAVLRADVSKVAPDATWIFHRVQDGYRDGIPRAVFIMPDDEPCGIPLIRNVAVIMDLAARLGREVERLTAEVTRAKADLLDIAERAIRQRDAAEMALGALREKARGVCHARRFPATLQHATDDLAAEVDKP